MDEFAIAIDEIPLQSCEQELLWELRKHIHLDTEQIIYFLPLNNGLKAKIICSTQKDYETLMGLETSKLTQIFKTIKITNNSFDVFKHSHVNPNLHYLPWEILCKIFNYCSLEDQINLAKVCIHFYKVISNIWHTKFTTQYFTYNYHHFKCELKWNDRTIRDLCIIAGKHVKKVRFMTYLHMDLLQRIFNTLAGNPMESLKVFINENFQSKVKHFGNLLELEVWGNFMSDLVTIDLIKYCKHLKTIIFYDSSNLWFKGLQLYELKKLENLCLKGCQNLDYIQFLQTSRHCHLKELNIVQCDALYDDMQLMIDYTKYWQYLNTLKITAFTADRRLIKALLALPVLKNLQFFWINDIPTHFEPNLFTELYDNEEKRQNLIQLDYENDRYTYENEGVQQLSPLSYEILRENVCISGQEWFWESSMFEMFSAKLSTFQNLHKIHYKYCRLLNYEQLKMLPYLNSNLQLIQIQGCPLRNDQQFYKEWDNELKLNCHKCLLKFVNFLSYQDVMILRSFAELRQYASYNRRDSVLRSITCYFQ